MSSENQAIPESVLKCIQEYIESYEQLETLPFLLARRDQRFTAQDVSNHLKMPTSSAMEALEHLAHHRFLDARGAADARHFQYGPQKEGVDGTVHLLAIAYEDQRLEMMKLMSANAIERVRTAAMRTFADSFLLKGKKKDG